MTCHLHVLVLLNDEHFYWVTMKLFLSYFLFSWILETSIDMMFVIFSCHRKKMKSCKNSLKQFLS
jgi:hypothetical protein